MCYRVRDEDFQAVQMRGYNGGDGGLGTHESRRAEG